MRNGGSRNVHAKKREGGRSRWWVELSSSFLVVASEKRVVARAKLQPSPGLRASLLGCLLCLKMPHGVKEQLMSDNTMKSHY
jgi:hypothetical protein